MYRSCHELAVEGSLHDLAEELLAKHLLSQLHQLKKKHIGSFYTFWE